MFWSWLRDELDGRIEADARIRRPLVVDLDDLEPVLALVEQGERIFDLFQRFLASDLAEFPMRNWLAREFDFSEEHHPTYVREQWQLAAMAGAEALYPGSEKLARALAQENYA